MTVSAGGQPIGQTFCGAAAGGDGRLAVRVEAMVIPNVSVNHSLLTVFGLAAYSQEHTFLITPSRDVETVLRGQRGGRPRWGCRGKSVYSPGITGWLLACFLGLTSSCGGSFDDFLPAQTPGPSLYFSACMRLELWYRMKYDMYTRYVRVVGG